jgi:hypothetical protein
MKLHYIATLFVTGAAPSASAANPSTITDTGGSTITDKQGHTAVVVHPPSVSDARSYGQFSSPAPILGD